MQEGLLWRDGRAGEMAEKVLEAAGAYRNKFGHRANCCHVHPKMLPDGAVRGKAGGVTIIADPCVLPNEFWVGVAEDEECSAQACPGSD